MLLLCRTYRKCNVFVNNLAAFSVPSFNNGANQPDASTTKQVDCSVGGSFKHFDLIFQTRSAPEQVILVVQVNRSV